MTDIILDGHISDKFTNGTSSKAVSLTTTQSKGRVVVWVSAEAGTLLSVTSVTSAHLTFTFRKTANFLNSNHVVLEEWYADYTSALSSESITVDLSGNVDGGTIIAAGYSNGTDAISFDTNGSVPATANSTSNAACQVGGVSSDTSAGTIVAAWATTFANDGNGALPGSDGYTTVDHFNDSNAGLNSFIEAEYKAFSGGALSSATVDFNRATEKFVIIADVLTVAPPAAPSGTWASTEADDTMTFTGGILGGSWASTEAADIMDFVSVPAGIWASTEAKDAMAFVGHPELAGVWSSIEITDAMSAAAVGPPITYFNPLTATGVDFQNENLTIVNQEAFNEPVGALSNTSHTNGKFYAEFQTTLLNISSGLGIANSATTFSGFGTTPTYALGGAGIFQDLNGTIWVNGIQQTNWQGVTLDGANVGIAVDITNSLIWFRVNGGHWNGITGANPATGVGGYDISGLTGGPIYLIGEVFGAYDEITMNAGASAFTYTAPSGFSSWDNAPISVPIQLDGYASNGLSETGPSFTALLTGTVTLSTTQNDDVIVVTIATGGFDNATTVHDITSTSGLTWKRRHQRWQGGGTKFNGSMVINRGLDMEIWWAHAPLALSGEVITINIDTTPYTNPGGSGTTTGVGSISLVAFGVSGANYTTPWDTHTQAGGYVNTGASGTALNFFPPTASLATKADNAFLFGFHGNTEADAGVTTTPWTYIAGATGTEHNGNPSFASVVYQIVEEPQSNTDVLMGTTVGGVGVVYSAESIMFDSIVAADETGTDQEIVWFWDPGSVNNVVQLTTGNTLSMSYSSTNFNLMVIVEVAILSASGLGEVLSISEGQGSLSSTGFERRSRTVTATPHGTLSVEIWWGWMPMFTEAERPNGDTITVNFTGTASGDVVGAIMWGLGGSTGAYGLGDPFWDVNPSVPSGNSSTGSSPPPYATDISTTIPSDLLVAWTANTTENVPGFTNPFITLIQSSPRTILPNMQLNSSAPAMFTGMEFLYESGLATNETAEFIEGSPEPDGWIVVADAIPVGPPQPPSGTMHVADQQDKFTHNGDYTAIGIASPGGWVGLVEIHGTMAATDQEDICGGTPNLGYSPFLGEGWLGCIPAFATWASVEGEGDDMAFYGWVLGFGITGQIGAAEAKDRMAFSNRATVTGTMEAVESKDRWGSAGLVLPPGHIHPTTPNKRRLLIIT